MGYWAAKMLHQKGKAVIVGIVEKNSAIYDENGLDPDDVKSHFTRYGTLNYYPKG